MKVQPYAIESFEVGDAHWVVVPEQGGDTVQLCLDLGGGEGPIVATAEWIPSATMVGGGFLYWTVNGEGITNDPRWVPAPVLTAVKKMAFGINARHEAERRAGR